MSILQIYDVHEWLNLVGDGGTDYKSLSLNLLYYVEACNEFAGPISM